MEINPGEYSHFIDEDEDPAQEALNNLNKYLPVEIVSTREAFGVMSDFVETVKDKQCNSG